MHEWFLLTCSYGDVNDYVTFQKCTWTVNRQWKTFEISQATTDQNTNNPTSYAPFFSQP